MLASIGFLRFGEWFCRLGLEPYISSLYYSIILDTFISNFPLSLSLQKYSSPFPFMPFLSASAVSLNLSSWLPPFDPALFEKSYSFLRSELLTEKWCAAVEIDFPESLTLAWFAWNSILSLIFWFRSESLSVLSPPSTLKVMAYSSSSSISTFLWEF